jgi:ribosomal protein S19E (S16A)
LAPEDPDWIFTRIGIRDINIFNCLASVARKVYLRAHIGVGSLKHLYGGNKRNGVQRRHHRQAAGGIVRYSLHYLENLGILQKDKKSAEKKFSRIVTPNGRKEMDVVANTIAKTLYPRSN